MINCCSGLVTLRGSAPATQGCLTQELEGKEEEEVVVGVGAAGNMAQASVSSVTGELAGQVADFRFYPGMDTSPGSVVRRRTGEVFLTPLCVSCIVMFNTHCKNKWMLNEHFGRCYKCHESGHIAKDCSKEDVCYVCNKVFLCHCDFSFSCDVAFFKISLSGTQL